MNPDETERLEQRLRALGKDFRYPSTPDLAVQLRVRNERGNRRRLTPRRLAWALLGALLSLLLFVTAVPQARAAVVQALRLGAVRILMGAGMPREPAATDQGVIGHSIGPDSGLELAGETTLVEAAMQVPFPISLPAYPADLGPPDRVFLQDSSGAVLILVWLQPEPAEGARMALYLVESGAFIIKETPPVVRHATVDGEPAIWTEGIHLLRNRAGAYEERRLVQGHVLIWMTDEVTFRLETELPLAEAVKVAESMK